MNCHLYIRCRNLLSLNSLCFHLFSLQFYCSLASCQSQSNVFIFFYSEMKWMFLLLHFMLSIRLLGTTRINRIFSTKCNKKREKKIVCNKSQVFVVIYVITSIHKYYNNLSTFLVIFRLMFYFRLIFFGFLVFFFLVYS